MQKQKKNKTDIRKSMMLILTCTVLLVTSTFSGCIEKSGTTIDEEDLGPGLTRLPDGRLAIDPDMFGENLVYDGETLSSIDTIGGGDGYRSDSSIENTVEAMTHNSMNFANNSVFDALGLIRTSNGRLYTATASNLQTAIWSLNDTGGVIYYPVFNLSIDESLKIDHANISIIGCGISNSILYGDGLDNDNVFNITADNVTISGFSINPNTGGDALVGDTDTQCGIYVYDSNYVTIENVELKNCGSHSLMFIQCEQCNVFHSYFDDSNRSHISVYSNSKHFEIRGNTFIEPHADHSCIVSHGDTNDINILNNYFYDSDESAIYLHDNVDNSLIQNNYFEWSIDPDFGVRIITNAGEEDCDNIIIRDNVFNVNNQDLDTCVSILDGSFFLVEGNTIKDSSYPSAIGIQLGRDTHNSSVCYNYIDDVKYGCYMQGTDNVYNFNQFYSLTDAHYKSSGSEIRPLINNIGTNAGDPNSAGDWQGYGELGNYVFDSTNDVFYLYNATGWQALN